MIAALSRDALTKARTRKAYAHCDTKERTPPFRTLVRSPLSKRSSSPLRERKANSAAAQVDVAAVPAAARNRKAPAHRAQQTKRPVPTTEGNTPDVATQVTKVDATFAVIV